MDRSWFEKYPEGIRKQIDSHHYNSIIQVLDDSVALYQNSIAYSCMGSNMTYLELDEYSRAFAAYLQNDLHLKPGDRIAIQLPNCLQFPVCLFGALRAGLIVVNTNPIYTPREMQHQFKDSGAKAIVILANFASNLEEIIKQTDIEHVIVTSIGDLLGGLKGRFVNFAVRYFKGMEPKYDLPNHHTLKHALEHGKREKFRQPKIQGTDVAFLQYTGGTTGVAKGAMLTHQNITSNMDQCQAWMEKSLEEGKEVNIVALPLYHIFSLTVNCLLFTKYGARNILIPNPKDLPSLIKDMRKYHFTVFIGVNTLFNALMNHEDFKRINFKYLKVCVAGGMALQTSIGQRWKELTGHHIAEGYGMTEASPVIACNRIDGVVRYGTVGLPLPGTDVKIESEDSHEVKDGTPGEIWVMGPQVMAGYWNKPEETAKVMHGHWLKTGDVGIMEDGYLKIVDRIKDMILVSGFNVYPNEIEDVVALMPSVKEVAAIGIPDTASGEVVKLFVVPKDPSLTIDQVLNHCKDNLTNYKRPKEIEFRTELPKTNIGKIMRRQLRDEELAKKK